MELEQLRREHRDEITLFLRGVFRAPADAPFLQPEVMEWKCFTERPDWSGSRAYVYRVDGEIVAYGCPVPCVVACPDADYRIMSVIDWAANGRVRGAGLRLIVALTSLGDARVNYGGSAIAQSIAKASAISRAFGDFAAAQRVIRIQRQRAAGAAHPFRARLRWARNLARNIVRPVTGTGAWKAHHVDRFDETLPDTAHIVGRTDLALPVRSAALLNFMLSCPSALTRGYLLEHESRVRGHLLLFGAGNSVRVADLQVASPVDGDWAACFALALRHAHDDFPDAVVVDATVFPPPLQRAAARAGFNDRSIRPCRVHDPRKLLDDARPIAISMMDSDAAWLV
jgi:hypothetical protein